MNLLGKIAEPSLWRAVREDEYYAFYRDELLEVWEAFCKDKAIPPLLYSKYRLFFETGDRLSYEKDYFDRRQMLVCSALLSLIYPEEPKYFSLLSDVIFDICTEYTWCLPAHIEPQGEGVIDPPFVVDLFASETAFMLAEISVLFSDRLDELVKRRISDEVSKRVIDSTLSKHGGWTWERKNNNWPAVCAGSIGCAAMLLFPDKMWELEPRLNAAMENYLSGFLGEGACLEGANYWDYGFGFFTVYADMLERFTDGADNYFDRQDVKAAALFISKIYLTGNTVASFSDSNRSYYASRGIINYLTARYPEDFRLPKGATTSLNVLRGRLSYLLFAAAYPDQTEKICDVSEKENDCFYSPKAEWYVNKNSQFALAAKGGNNKEPHNHNDIGHFVFAKDNRQIFADLGSGVYDKNYFSPRRYESFEPSSFAHSIPLIDGAGQLPGEQYASKNARAGADFFEVDIAGAYGIEKLKSLCRRFDISTDSVTVTDRFDISGDVKIVERFITLAEPARVGDNQIAVDGATLEFSAGVASVQISKKATAKNECYIIDLALAGGVTHFVATIK